MMKIPFNKPYLAPGAIEEIRGVLESGKTCGDGPVCQAVEERLRRLFSVKHVLLTTSCTHALEMAMMMLDLKPGEEVIMPSFTFVSTANAVIRCGGKPVFCEINARTLTMDAADFQKRITGKTRAVVPVHYAGVSAELDEITEIARESGLAVIEDAAQGVNALYKGKFLGTIGDAGAYSFHDTKNYISGEGGAFLTQSEALARKAEIIREKGTNRSNFLRGEVDKYTWVEQGSSYILSDILAGILNSQLDDLDFIQKRREDIHRFYVEGLKDLEKQEKLQLPFIPDYCRSNYHIFFVLLKNEEERNRVMRKMKGFGVGTTFHYIPLHSSPYAVRSLGTADLKLPVTDRISGSLLRLPIYPQLEKRELDYITGKLGELLI